MEDVRKRDGVKLVKTRTEKLEKDGMGDKMEAKIKDSC